MTHLVFLAGCVPPSAPVDGTPSPEPDLEQGQTLAECPAATQIGGEGTTVTGPLEVEMVLPAPDAADVAPDSWLFTATSVSRNDLEVQVSGDAPVTGEVRELLFFQEGSPRFVYFVPDAPFAPLTVHDVVLTGDPWYVVPGAATFTTGEATTPAPGTVDVVSVQFEDCVGEGAAYQRQMDVELDIDVDAPSIVRIHADDGSGCGALDFDDSFDPYASTTSSTTGEDDIVLGWVTLHEAFVVDAATTSITRSLTDRFDWGADSDCVCAVVMSVAGVDGPVSATVCAP